jgi:predicted RNase H-like nuclease (RuvC/YqgF family)
VKEARPRNDKEKADGSLEPVLEAIEERVEALVEIVKSLAAENARLKSEVSAAKAKADEGGEAAMLLARYEDERNAVKERIERVLKTLDETAGAGKA